MLKQNKYDVIIIGGSFAGLSAALSLGRALHTVLVIDSGKPCNRQTPHSQNFITHDGESPAAIREKALKDVQKYPAIHYKAGEAVRAERLEESFGVVTADGDSFLAKKLLFATGMSDKLPEIPGFAECWGISLIHCPYCHGYEVRNRPTGIFANGHTAFELGKFIRHWTDSLCIFTNGPAEFEPGELELLQKLDIEVIEKEVKGLEHKNGQMQNVVFGDGSRRAVDAMYIRPLMVQSSFLPAQLGCELTENGHIVINNHQTTVPGVYAAGDNSNPFRAVSIAVAAGTGAGAFINKEIIKEYL